MKRFNSTAEQMESMPLGALFFECQEQIKSWTIDDIKKNPVEYSFILDWLTKVEQHLPDIVTDPKCLLEWLAKVEQQLIDIAIEMKD